MDDLDLDVIRERLARLKRQRITGEARRAAVLVLFGTVEDEPAVLFTRRSETVGTHKGHVSFPGGMTDPEDAGPEDTALREFEEELGIARSSIEVLGMHHDVRAITGVPVTPVLGWAGALDIDAMTPSEAEIDAVFTLTLAALADPSSRYSQTLSRDGRSARFTVFDAGPFPVWGLTSYILEALLHEVVGLVLAPPTGEPRHDLP